MSLSPLPERQITKLSCSLRFNFSIAAKACALSNAGIIPSYEYKTEDLVLSIGIAAYMSLNAEESKTNFYTYLF